MSSCAVCAATAAVFCEQDNAFLCLKCDQSIHSANVLSSRHVRRPLCDLCHRSVAAVWCKEDAAHLCSGCDAEVHASNPIPHERVPVSLACTKNAAPCCPGYNAAAPLRSVGPPMEDSNSACGKSGVLLPQKEGSCEVRSVAVVPEMPQQQAEDSATAGGDGTSFLAKAPSLPKGFDFLDMDNSWLDRLDTGFDFADIFNTAGDVPASDGLVPTLSDNNASGSHELLGHHGSSNAGAAHSSAHDTNDLMVPSFSLSLPDELPLPQLSSLKRTASEDALIPPPNKHQRSSHVACLQSTPFQLKQEQPMPTPTMMAPQWHPMPMPPSAPQQPQQPQLAAAPPSLPNHCAPHQAAQLTAGLAGGAELTREQRVARYREKRKNRKFEKTIRYASRKAYAEVRPRIKGRFATREEVIALKAQKAQQEQQQMFQLQMVDEDCVVPNFM